MDICSKYNICLVKKTYDKLDKSLQNCDSVILIFSNTEIRFFTGYSKMITEPDDISFIKDDIEETIDTNNYTKYVKIEWVI